MKCNIETSNKMIRINIIIRNSFSSYLKGLEEVINKVNFAFSFSFRSEWIVPMPIIYSHLDGFKVETELVAWFATSLSLLQATTTFLLRYTKI